MITVTVHMNNHPAVGVVTDDETRISMIFHHGGGAWTPIGAIKAGDPEVRQPPAYFTVPEAVRRELDLELGVH